MHTLDDIRGQMCADIPVCGHQCSEVIGVTSNRDSVRDEVKRQDEVAESPDDYALLLDEDGRILQFVVEDVRCR